VPFVLSRVSLPAMVAIGVGGYIAKRVLDNNPPAPPEPPKPPAASR
jgi:hypothetical protein